MRGIGDLRAVEILADHIGPPFVSCRVAKYCPKLGVSSKRNAEINRQHRER
jgi:hypothetical protein